MLIAGFFSLGEIRGQEVDTLRWALGPVLSPDYTNETTTGNSEATEPILGGTFGFKAYRRLKRNLYLESGFNLFRMGYKSSVYTNLNYDKYHKLLSVDEYYYITTCNFLSMPFLLHYNIGDGAIRFQIGGGIGLNVLFSSGDYRFDNDANYQWNWLSGDSDLMFVPSLGGIAKSGINIKLNDHSFIGVFPAFRYNIISGFSSGEYRFKSSEFHPFSAGIEISYMIKIRNDRFPNLVNIDDKARIKNEDLSGNGKDLRNDPGNLERKSIIYVELFGNGGAYSVNYERNILSKGILNLNGRCCLAIIPGNKFVTPFGVNMALGRSTDKFETGLGLTLFHYDNSQPDMAFIPSVGYRLETRSNNFFRLAFTPIVHLDYSDMVPLIGISYGRKL